MCRTLFLSSGSSRFAASGFGRSSRPCSSTRRIGHGDGLALEVLGRMLRRLDVESDEVVVHLTLDADRVADDWEKSCRLLGSEYRPKLVSICNADEDAWRAVSELKAAGSVLGAGVVARDFGSLNSLTPSVDWVVLTGGFTLMRHPAELLASMAELAARQIPIVVSGVFDGGFLVGSNRLDGRVLSAEDPADRSLLTWRTSFAALCHGHGVTPAQACIQFALSGPGVVAVMLNSSHPDRVAENIAFCAADGAGCFLGVDEGRRTARGRLSVRGAVKTRDFR